MKWKKQFYVRLGDRADRWNIVNGKTYYKDYYFTSFQQAKKCADFLNELFERKSPRNFGDFKIKSEGQYRYWIMDQDSKVCYCTKRVCAKHILEYVELICCSSHDVIVDEGRSSRRGL